jgi:hypothetical protein
MHGTVNLKFSPTDFYLQSVNFIANDSTTHCVCCSRGCRTFRLRCGVVRFTELYVVMQLFYCIMIARCRQRVWNCVLLDRKCVSDLHIHSKTKFSAFALPVAATRQMTTLTTERLDAPTNTPQICLPKLIFHRRNRLQNTRTYWMLSRYSSTVRLAPHARTHVHGTRCVSTNLLSIKHIKFHAHVTRSLHRTAKG